MNLCENIGNETNNAETMIFTQYYRFLLNLERSRWQKE